MTNELAGNPLKSRRDLQAAAKTLARPVVDRLSVGGARARLGYASAMYTAEVAELEAFARPLWGLAPLAAGGGDVDLEPFRRGLSSGTDPGHPEYWGAARANDQRLVEMAAIAMALVLVPGELWEPLDRTAQCNLVRWLSRINEVAVNDNNWLYFKVMVNEALHRIDPAHADLAGQVEALDRLESFNLGDGWYSDGPTARRDYYVPWAMHYYGLVYARVAGDRDPERATRFREQAAIFAADFECWFADDGSALPFGRSLTYRFAQGAFWAALVFADVEALPWGHIKGLLLRHLRWWSGQPIFDNAGLLSVGYRYPNPAMGEQYNSAGSPYWAMKVFLPIAQQEDHPFWRAAEAGPPELPGVSKQPSSGMIISRRRGQVQALASGQHHVAVRHGAAKYAKFAYSTAFGFSVPAGDRGLAQLAPDSMLALSEDDVHWHVRSDVEESGMDGDVLWSRWKPWPDVDVDTWLWFHELWQIRVHRIATARRLLSAEGAYAVDSDVQHESRVGEGYALCATPTTMSGVRDVSGHRRGEVIQPYPGTNVLFPRTSLPIIEGDHEVGEHWLYTVVLAVAGKQEWADEWSSPPAAKRIMEVVHARSLAR